MNLARQTVAFPGLRHALAFRRIFLELTIEHGQLIVGPRQLAV